MRRPVESSRFFTGFIEQGFVLPPSGRCRHASIRTLEERFVSLGACWAFSLQPVLPSVWRPVVLLFRVEPGPGHYRSHRNSALGFCLSSCWNVFDFVLRFVLRSCNYQAAAVV